MNKSHPTPLERASTAYLDLATQVDLLRRREITPRELLDGVLADISSLDHHGEGTAGTDRLGAFITVMDPTLHAPV
ncbi:MAG: hypothetical protein ACP5PJ_10555, partial [Acidimicrobiales bacterium]